MDSLLEGLHEFPTLTQLLSLEIDLKHIMSDYIHGHIIRELHTWGAYMCSCNVPF